MTLILRRLPLALAASAFAAFTLCSCGSPRNEVQPDPAHPVLAIGAAAPDFSLPGTDNKTHTLSEFAGAKVLAIVFDCNHCAESHLYAARIRKLYDDYHAKGVALIAVSPDNPVNVHYADLAFSDANDSLIEMQDRVADQHIEYPFLYDGDSQSLTGKLGAVATPQIFIFDQARKLRYEGRIDDNHNPTQVRSSDAADALDALLAGKQVATPTTPVTGCATLWNSKVPPDPELAKVNTEPVSIQMTTPEILKKLRGNGTGKMLLVNFWATWCGPCVSEFPNLEDTYRMYRGRGLTMTTVSEDVPEAKPDVITFLTNKHASGVNLLFSSDDTASVQDQFDPQMSGAVPFTLLFDEKGNVLYQEQGEISMGKLRRAILANLPDDNDHLGQQIYWKQNLQ